MSHCIALVMVTLIMSKAPEMFAKKQPYIMMLPSPCFTVGLLILGPYLLSPNMTGHGELFPKYCIFIPSPQSVLFQKSSDFSKVF